MTPTFIHKLNLGVNMSFNMRHAPNSMFCLLSVSCLVSELFLLTHDRYANSMLYIKIENHVEGITIPTQMLAARAPQAKRNSMLVL